MHMRTSKHKHILFAITYFTIKRADCDTVGMLTCVHEWWNNVEAITTTKTNKTNKKIKDNVRERAKYTETVRANG